MDELKLYFKSTPEPELNRIRFSSKKLPYVVEAIRGKHQLVPSSVGVFQWSSAIKALCMLLLKCSKGSDRKLSAVLIGFKGNPAWHLYRALHERTPWIYDMFGCLKDGTPLLCKLIKATNLRTKYPETVALSLVKGILDSKNIKIYCDGELQQERDQIQGLIQRLQANFKHEKSAATSEGKILLFRRPG